MVENYTGQSLGSQVWYCYQDRLHFTTELIKLPIISLDAFTYLDADNVSQTMASFTTVHTDLVSKPARVEVEDIPDLYDHGFNQVTFEITVGYAVIPDPLIQAITMMCGHWYENRQDVVTGTQVNEMPEASKYLMNPYVYYEFR